MNSRGRARRNGYGGVRSRRIPRIYRAASIGIVIGLLMGVPGLELSRAQDWRVVAEVPIPVGVLYPVTGPLSDWGKEAWEGVQLALIEINGNRGIRGKKIRAVLKDTGGNPGRALEHLETFRTSERPVAIMGVYDSEVATATSEFCRKQGMVFVGAGHLEDALILERFHRGYFHVTPSVHQLAYAAGLAASQQHWTRYAVCGPSTPTAKRALDSFRNAHTDKEKTITVTHEYWTAPNDFDFTPAINALRTADLDAVLCLYEHGSLREFMRQGVLLGLFRSATMICPFGGGDYLTLENMKDDMPRGLMGAHHHLNWPSAPQNRAFIVKFKSRTGRYPTQSAADGYVALWFVAKALEASWDDLDRETLIASMEKLRLSCPWDPPGFTSYMDAAAHQMVLPLAVGRTKDGSAFPPATKSLGDWFVPSPHAIMVENWDIFESRFPKNW